jgi:hypothetical protein
MPELIPNDIGDVLRRRRCPTVTVWNRLEGRPRTRSFERALRAEVRDALWMLSRQWQLGEFQGDDAGSPFFAKMHLATTRVTKYQPRDEPPQPFDDTVPLEAKVEARPIPLTIGSRTSALELRLAMGRQWLKLIDGIGNYRQAFVGHYRVVAPNPSQSAHADRAAHPEVSQLFAAAAGRAMDGGRLYLHLVKDPANRPYDGMSSVADQDKQDLDEAAERFVAWFQRLFHQPPAGDDDAWVPERLEYRFSLSAPESDGEKVLSADEYYGGRFDWYSVDVEPDSEGLGDVPDASAPPPGELTQTLVPVPLEFEGMPNTRWWAFEDRKTNFGAIDAATTDIAKLLFVEFGLIYANDWFLVPCPLHAGDVANVRGLAVTNVFGERTWVEAAGRGADDDWQRWTMFTVSVAGSGPEAADTSLLLLPTVPKVQQGEPAEEVLLVRDEIANMVWGVERVVPLPDGRSKPGAEAAGETVAFHQRLLADRLAVAPPAEPPKVADIRYQVMTTVPEHWIPFLPVHVPGSSREIQLQRAGLPRVMENDPDPPARVQPRTVLMREGLDRTPAAPYFVHEEEVPRAGARVFQSFQRTRWRDGRAYVWLGVQKQTGRGEGSSGLAFDQIFPVD